MKTVHDFVLNDLHLPWPMHGYKGTGEFWVICAQRVGDDFHSCEGIGFLPLDLQLRVLWLVGPFGSLNSLSLPSILAL